LAGLGIGLGEVGLQVGLLVVNLVLVVCWRRWLMQSRTAFVLAMEWLSRWMFASRWLRVLWWRRMTSVINEVSITIIGGVSVVGIGVIVGIRWCCFIVAWHCGAARS